MRTIAVFLFCFLCVQLAGCSRKAGKIEKGSVVVKDDLGRDVRIAERPERIVSLAPSLTEMAFALGRGNALVGVTRFCDYPPEVASVHRIGDIVNPSIEAIVGLKPDIVLMTVEGNTRQTFDKLNELGVTVLVSNPRSLDDVLASLTKLGAALGAQARARALTDSLDAFRSAISASSDETAPSVLLLISLDPPMAAGKGSYLDEMIRIAGAHNAGAVGISRYPVVSREEILRADPDHLLVSSDLSTDRQALLRRFPEWRNMKAFSSGGYRSVDANLFLRPGPRVFEGLRRLSEMLKEHAAAHPD